VSTCCACLNPERYPKVFVVDETLQRPKIVRKRWSRADSTSFRGVWAETAENNRPHPKTACERRDAGEGGNVTSRAQPLSAWEREGVGGKAGPGSKRWGLGGGGGGGGETTVTVAVDYNLWDLSRR